MTDQDQERFSSPFDEIPSNEEVPAALDWGHWSRTLEHLMALFAHGTRLGSAQRSEPSSRLTTSRKVHEGPVQTTQSLDNYSDYEDWRNVALLGGGERA